MTVTPTKDSIETFHVYGKESEDGEQFYSLWVEHEGGFEYPVIQCMTGGGVVLNSADPSFNTVEANEVHEEFYPSVAGNLARPVEEGAHVFDDCYAFMSDELGAVEKELAGEIIRRVGSGQFVDAGIPFEVEEIIDRGMENFAEEMDVAETVEEGDVEE